MKRPCVFDLSNKRLNCCGKSHSVAHGRGAEIYPQLYFGSEGAWISEWDNCLLFFPITPSSAQQGRNTCHFRTSLMATKTTSKKAPKDPTVTPSTSLMRSKRIRESVPSLASYLGNTNIRMFEIPRKFGILEDAGNLSL